MGSAWGEGVDVLATNREGSGKITLPKPAMATGWEPRAGGPAWGAPAKSLSGGGRRKAESIPTGLRGFSV